MSTKKTPTVFTVDEAEIYFQLLREAYNQEIISFPYYKEVLGTMKYLDKNANIWTIGSRTGQWYQRIENTWVPGSPKGLLIYLLLFSKFKNRSDGAMGSEKVPKKYLSPIMRELLKQGTKKSD